MIEYYEQLMQEEQQELTEVIRLLFRQTYILERKYDKRTKRLAYNKDFRACSRHMEFIRDYLAISGIELLENTQLGIFYIQGENVLGEKLSKLATLYLLLLKIIYDEQMMTASTSNNIYTTIGEMHDRLGSFRLLDKQPSYTEKRTAVAMLKKYQLIEVMDGMDEMDPQTRLLIYPSINMVLFGDDAREILKSFGEETTDEGEKSEIPGLIQDVPE